MFPRAKISIIAAALALGLTVASAARLAAENGTATREANDSLPTHRGAYEHACNSGVSLTLSSSAVPQGSLILVQLSAKAPLGSAKAEWDSREIPLWRSSSRMVWTGLLGVDLEKPPGHYQARMTGQSDSGEAFRCVATIEVRVGRFPTENLKVQPQFVEPDP